MDRTSELRALIGLRIRELRRENHWTAAEVCRRVDGAWAKSWQCKLERGEVPISVEHLGKLAFAFRLDVLDLLCFPSAEPLRHGLYDKLRRAPEHVLRQTEAFVIGQMATRADGEPTREKATEATYISKAKEAR